MITIQRFQQNIHIDILNGCWEWKGTLDKDGYGKIGINKKLVSAHRFSYSFFIGKLNPLLEIDHLCRNPSCVNPSHLEQVTQLENIMRGTSANKTYCHRGHKFTKENTYVKKSGQRRCRICKRYTDTKYRNKKNQLEVITN